MILLLIPPVELSGADAAEQTGCWQVDFASALVSIPQLRSLNEPVHVRAGAPILASHSAIY
jgi:hypothetical protein